MVCEEASVGVEVPKTALPQEIRRRVWPQHLAALLATLLAMSGGIVMGWSTPAVPYLQEPVNDTHNGTIVPITDEEGSWLGSLSAIGALVGAAPAGFLSDLVGRKRMLLLFSLPLIASWIMIILVDRNLPLLYLARILGGITIGSCYAISPVYCEEISEVRWRGMTCSYCELMICLGVEVAFILGTYMNYIHFHIFCCTLPVVFLLTFVWMPESPMWLLTKGRDEEAEKSLRWLRGATSAPDKGISAELGDMKVFLNGEDVTCSSAETLGPVAEKGFCSKPSVKVGFIVFWLMVFQQMNGNNAVMFNAVNVYKDARVSLDSTVASMITGFLQAVGAVMSGFTVDLAGRRPLLILAMVVSAVCLAALALYFHFKAELVGMGWLPIVFISTLIFTAEVGFGPLPWIIMAELSPPHSKKIIGAIGCAANWSLVFAVTKSYTDMVGAMGLSFTYAMYSMFCVTGIFFVVFFVPETKHKTREQIQYELMNGRHSMMPTKLAYS